MNHRHAVKLVPAEAKRLEQYIEKSGGQPKASLFFGVAISTLSRTVNRHTAPSPLLREKLVEIGIVKA